MSRTPALRRLLQSRDRAASSLGRDRGVAQGIRATLFEAAERIGGRCWSPRNVFPGQVVERGGEFIDTAHKAMLAYANEFGLALEDVNKNPGEVFYFPTRKRSTI